MEAICTFCGTHFTCYLKGDCWCASLPHGIPVPAPRTAGCLCRDCLLSKLRSLDRVNEQAGIDPANK